MPLPDSSVKSIAPASDATPADIAEFQGPRTGPDSLPPQGLDMNGEQNRFQESSRYDAQPRGYSTEPAYTTGNAPTGEPPIPDQPAYQPQPIQDWQQAYGQSENEKGEWRSLALQMAQERQQVLEQLQGMQNRLTEIQAAPQPQYNPAPAGPPPRIFPEKPPGELMTWGEMEQVLWQEVLPTMIQRDSMTMEQARDAAAASAQRMLPSWDINGTEEAGAINTLRSTYPNFDQRFSATERNRMIQDQVALTRARTGQTSAATPRPPVMMPVGQLPGTQPPATRPIQPVQLVDPNRVIRQQTYIESASPAQMQREPSYAASPSSSYQQELAALDNEAKVKTGNPNARATAAQVKTLLQKYGIREVNDWAGGQVLTR